MRGPSYKITADVRRTWRCSRCGRERKLSGDVTTIACVCQDTPLMTIVREKINAPRPIQRPSDVERRPIDFGIEPAPPAPPKPEATIIKPAVSIEVEETVIVETVTVKTVDVVDPPATSEEGPTSQEPPKQDQEEEWGEGIL